MKKLFWAISLLAIFACLFSLCAFAEEITVNEIKSDTYGTVYQLSGDPGLDEADKYVSTLTNIVDAGTDTESLSILTDGTYFYVFPSSYITYEISNGKFEVYAGTDSKPGVNQAFSEWNNAEGTSLPQFELTGSYKSTNFVSLIRIEISSDVTYFDGNHCFLDFSNLKEVRFYEGQRVASGLFNSAPALETVIGLENTTGFNGTTHFFRGCTNLKTVSLPSGLTSIGKETFWGCSSLEVIGNWDEATKNITSVGQESFYNCSSLESMVLPNSVTSFGQSAFYGCKALTEFDVPDSLVTMGTKCFQGCSGITRLEFPQTTTSFGQDCFNGCSALTYVNIPRDCTYVGNYTFSGCSNIIIDMSEAESLTSWGSNNSIGNTTELVFPDGFTTLNSLSSSKVKKIVFPSTTTSIGVLQCSSLEEIVIPEGITSLRDKQFDYCASLKKVTLPRGLTSISTTGNTSFFGSTRNNLKEIVFTGTPDAEVIASIQKLLPSATITYANHCEIYYASEHIEANEVIKFVNSDGTAGEKFLSTANVCVDCTRCYETRVIKSVDPLFINKGWTFDENDQSALTQSFTVNRDVFPFYQESFGITDFGVAAAINTFFKGDEEIVNSNGDILDLDENGAIKSKDGAISASFIDTEYEILTLKVTGLSDSNAKAKIFISAYVISNGEINYLSNGKASVGVIDNSISVEALLKNEE